MPKRPFPSARVYQLLEPGPVVLMTTARNGRPNVMPLSWHTMMEFDAPLVGCVVSGRDFSFETLIATRECVLNIPTVELAQAVVGCGNSSGKRVDKFRRFGLTPVAASRVGAPLIAECFASLECRVADMGWVKRYNFFVLEVIEAWVDVRRRSPRTLHHRGCGSFMVAGPTRHLPSRMR